VLLGCERRHNDSVMDGIYADRAVIGGGESLMCNQQMEYRIT